MTTGSIYTPRVVLLDEPGEGWFVAHLRDYDQLLLNVGDLGLSETDRAEVREAIGHLGALLILTMHRRRDVDDQGLSGVARKFVGQFPRGRLPAAMARRMVVALGLRT